MLRDFTVAFCKATKSCLSLLATLPSLIDTLCTVARLKDPALIIYDVATKLLGIEVFPQHNIADLSSGITLIVLFLQPEEAFSVKENKHTHTHYSKCPLSTQVPDFPTRAMLVLKGTLGWY